MTDQQANIVPFGKYKSRSIEEVLFRLSAMARRAGLVPSQVRGPESGYHQPWCRAAGDARAQRVRVRFLHDDFCLRFLRCLAPELTEIPFEIEVEFEERGIDVVLVASDEKKNLPAPLYFAIGRRIGAPIRLLSKRRLASRSNLPSATITRPCCGR